MDAEDLSMVSSRFGRLMLQGTVKGTAEMNKSKKGLNWDEVIQGAGELPKGHAGKSFTERAAEAEAWAKELKDAPAGTPIVRMGRPNKNQPKVVTELVTFRTERGEKEALEALALAQGRSLSDLLRGVTHDLVNTFKAGQKAARAMV